MKKKCSKCPKPSIKGLTKGNGLCQYHWNEGVWGKEWADKVENDRLIANGADRIRRVIDKKL